MLSPTAFNIFKCRGRQRFQYSDVSDSAKNYKMAIFKPKPSQF
jgi:hypothetical protein